MVVDGNLKQFILSNYNQELLYSKYLEIDIYDIIYSIENGTNLKNPHRDDKVASLAFRYVNEKLKMWDFGSLLYRGDIFDLVGMILNKNPNNSLDFIEICRFIIKDNKTSDIIPHQSNQLINKTSVISYVPKNFSNFDISYFNEGGITKYHLILRGVEAAKSTSYNNRVYYEFNRHDPIYVYNLGFDNDKSIIKTYRPFTTLKTDKFKTNNPYPIEGHEELYESEVLIITKSRKDKLVFESYLDNGTIVKSLGKLINKLSLPPFIKYPYINATYNQNYKLNTKHCVINLKSESILLDEELVNLFKSKHKRIYINYDYDLSGILNAFYYVKLYDFIPVFIGRDSISILEGLNENLKFKIVSKFSQFNINIDFIELERFIIDNAGFETAKDVYELSKISKQKCKEFINDKFK